MKRMHVHVAVGNLADSIQFYSTLFGAEPSITKPDYAKWMLDDPRMNFAVSQRGQKPGLNHLGVQVESSDELAEMHARLEALQAGYTVEEGATCCYARSDKYWATDPQGIAWETFHTLDNIPVFGSNHGTMTVSATSGAPAGTESRKETACCGPVKEKRREGQRMEAGVCC
ncbi:MAG: VOC family protein [Nitrosospira sp.]|nr:VOC family protein [Nitrosospira sp.]